MTNSSVSKGKNGLKDLAIFSVGAYVIFSTVFDTFTTKLSGLSSVFIYLCAFCCALYVLQRGKVRIDYISGALMVTGVLFLVTALYTPASDSIVKMYLHRYIASVVLVVMVSNVVTEREDVEKILNCYVIAGVLLSLTMYYMYGFKNLAASLERLDGQLGNQNITGISCAFTIIISVYLFTVKKKGNRFWYILSIVLCTPAVMFTGSRKSLLIIIVALIAFLFSYSRNTAFLTKAFVVLVILITAYVVIFYVPAFSMIKERLLATLVLFGENAAEDALKGDTNRINYIKQGLSEFLKSPIWGNGFCYSYYYLSKYTHNNYVELLMNGGLLTFGAYYSMYASIWKRASALARKHKDLIRSSLAFTVLAAVLFMDFGVVSYYKRYTLVLLAICFNDVTAALKSYSADNEAEKEVKK